MMIAYPIVDVIRLSDHYMNKWTEEYDEIVTDLAIDLLNSTHGSFLNIFRQINSTADARKWIEKQGWAYSPQLERRMHLQYNIERAKTLFNKCIRVHAELNNIHTVYLTDDEAFTISGILQ